MRVAITGAATGIGAEEASRLVRKIIGRYFYRKHGLASRRYVARGIAS